MNALCAFLKGLGLALAVGVVVIASASAADATRPAKRNPAFNPNASQNQSAFLVPGVSVKILSAKIDTDGTIQARFKLTDSKGGPLDIDGVTSPGPVAVRLVAAYIPAGQKQYVAYTTTVLKATLNNSSTTQAGTDSGGVFTKVSDGVYDYTFRTKAPKGFDASATHTIGIQAQRNLADFGLGSQGIDDVFNFVPNGSPVTNVRNIIDTATCNKCHNPISAHGGSRTKIEYCDLCHTPQSVNPDTGNTVDMPVMIHKIHRGADLPSVKAGGKYQIFHRGAYSDFSDVVFPANPDTRNCQVCHQPGTKQADAWLVPTRTACGSCHDDVNFATGENHVNLPQVSDNLCANCHVAQGELEFDASIKGAHTIPTQSKALAGVVFNILKVDNGTAGSQPVVTFTVKDKAGNPIIPSTMSRLRLILGASNADYTSGIAEDGTKATGSTDGTYSYTFSAKIPADATGSYTIGIEGRNAVKLMPGTKKEQSVNDAGANKTFAFSVDGSPVVARRTVVATAKCNSCHNGLAMHGGSRNAVEQCVLCHNPKATDSQKPAESIDFRTMVHKIHTGKNLTNQYTIGTANFNDVGYPGDRRDCAQCHVSNSQQLPMKPNLLMVNTPRGYTTETNPTTAACLGCHDDKITASHAMANTTRLGESCAACHGPNAEFSLDRVHAMTP